MWTDRREVWIEDRKGDAVGLIDDDRVRTTAAGARTRSFHEVEFEIADRADSDLVAKVMARLRDAGARPSKQRPKIVRVLGEAARVAPDVVPGDPLGRTSTPAVLAQSYLASSVHRLVTHDPVVRTDSDREGVHKARVATRRLRASEPADSGLSSRPRGLSRSGGMSWSESCWARFWMQMCCRACEASRSPARSVR